MCVVPGAGDHKLFFKWRLIQALLAEGLTVLVIDTPGHGDYRQRPMTCPDCLSAISSAIEFLRGQPGIKRVGLAGISLGGALSIRAVADSQAAQPPDGDPVDALVVLETPVMLAYHRTLFYREAWAAFRAPVLSLLREISVKQMVQSWKSGGYRSPHTTTELIDMLNPLDNLSRLRNIPILLVYSERDPVAPSTAARAMQNAAPGADMLTSVNASHVTMTLMPEVNRQVARWLRRQLSRPATSHGQDE